MKLYGNNFSSNSNKVRFVANAIGIDYEFQSINLAAGEQRAEAFLKVAPLGRIPVLSDGNFTIFESNAIIRYLAEKSNSPLYSKDLEKHSLINQWLDFGSIHLGAGAMNKIFFNTIIYKMVNATRDDVSLKEGRQFLANYLKIIDTQLKESTFICGSEMTLADINILAILDPCEVVSFNLSAFPRLSEYRKSLQAEDFYKKVFPSYTEFVKSILQKA